MRTNFSKEEMKQRMVADPLEGQVVYDATVKGTICLNVREEPNGSIITAVDFGTLLTGVTYVEPDRKWCNVTIPDGRRGYVMTEYLDLKVLD